MEIFCPNNHLILEDQVCKKCGWQRTLSGTIGQPLWGPVDILAGFGRESRDSFGKFNLLDDLLIVPLRSNELLGLSLSSGQIRWRVAVPVGKRVVGVVVESGKVFVTTQDTHSLMEVVKPGTISVLDPLNGSLTPFYTAPSHDLSIPIFWQDRFFVRTAESKLYALDRGDPTHALWDFPLGTWWATPMNLVEGRIVLVDGNAIFSNGSLLAVDAQKGSVCWQMELQSLPTKPLAAAGNQLALVNNKREVQVLNATTGELLWKRNFLTVYSSPVFHQNQLIVSVRGNKDKNSEQYYSLASLDSKTGETLWQVPLTSRVRISPACFGDLLMLADDGQKLRALNASDGSERWNFPLGHEEDPIHTHVFLTEKTAVAGTYYGQLVAITTREEKQAIVSPASYVKKGDWKSAAEAYALAATYGKAADIYSNKLGEIDKALQLYERGNEFSKAARLALDHKLYSLALEFYRKAQDVSGEAETLLYMGDLEGAAKLFKDLSNLPRAALVLEQAGKFQAAANLYLQAGKIGDYSRLILKTSWDATEAERLRDSGNIETAAMWEISNQMFLEAARDFRSLGRVYDELEALKKHVVQSANQVAQWVWQRIAELSEEQGDYITASRAWQKLDRPENAGYAFLKLADQKATEIIQPLESIPAQKKEELSTLYTQAADAFKAAGLSENEERCRDQVRRYQQLPKVVILEVESSSGFREMEWNSLRISVQNIGYGRAIDVTFRIGESRFEVQEQSRTFCFNLSSGLTKNHLLHLRPLRDQTGACVPLEIKWTWKDYRDGYWEENGRIPVRVVGQKDAESVPPIIYQIHNLGNLVQGTQIQGDSVEQKGDRVTINRQGGLSEPPGITVSADDGQVVRASKRRTASNAPMPFSKMCPSCGKANSPLAKHCVFCRTRFEEAECPPNANSDAGMGE